MKNQFTETSCPISHEEHAGIMDSSGFFQSPARAAGLPLPPQNPSS